MTITLSPSRINLYAECPRCFWLRVNEGVKRPQQPFPSLPSGIDEVITTHFDQFRELGELPPALRDAGIDAELVEDEEFLANCQNWQKEPVYRDEELDVVVRGGVDDLLKTVDGELIVLDYKTRGYPPSDEAPDYYRRQLDLYNLILLGSGYTTADYGYLLYYIPNKILDTGEFVFNTELQKVETDIENVRDLVTSAVTRIQGPIPDVNEDCEFCQWNQTDHTA